MQGGGNSLAFVLVMVDVFEEEKLFVSCRILIGKQLLYGSKRLPCSSHARPDEWRHRHPRHCPRHPHSVLRAHELAIANNLSLIIHNHTHQFINLFLFEINCRLLITCMRSPILAMRAPGTGETSSHWWSRRIWRPPVMSCISKVRKVVSECFGVPNVLWGSGQIG